MSPYIERHCSLRPATSIAQGCLTLRVDGFSTAVQAEGQDPSQRIAGGNCAEQPEFSISKQTLADCDVISLMSARLDGREVILVCPDGNVSRVLEIVQIGRQIAVYRRSTTSSPRGTGTGAHLIPTRRCVACRAGSSRPPWSNGDVWAAA